eukprot:COSAG01_NODE_9250_length_2504_cov_3.542067_1_plen_204_part_00
MHACNPPRMHSYSSAGRFHYEDFSSQQPDLLTRGLRPERPCGRAGWPYRLSPRSAARLGLPPPPGIEPQPQPQPQLQQPQTQPARPPPEEGVTAWCRRKSPAYPGQQRAAVWWWVSGGGEVVTAGVRAAGVLLGVCAATLSVLYIRQRPSQHTTLVVGAAAASKPASADASTRCGAAAGGVGVGATIAATAATRRRGPALRHR